MEEVLNNFITPSNDEIQNIAYQIADNWDWNQYDGKHELENIYDLATSVARELRGQTFKNINELKNIIYNKMNKIIGDYLKNWEYEESVKSSTSKKVIKEAELYDASDELEPFEDDQEEEMYAIDTDCFRKFVKLYRQWDPAAAENMTNYDFQDEYIKIIKSGYTQRQIANFNYKDLDRYYLPEWKKQI